MDERIEYSVKRLGLILAVQTETEGMKALNTYREARGESIAYGEGAFVEKAEEIREIVHKHDEQL